MRPRATSFARGCLISVLLMCVAACGRSTGAREPEGPLRQAFRGRVVGLDLPRAQVLVEREELTGYAAPGVFSVRVDDGEALRQFLVGDRLRGTLVVPADAEPWLEDVVVTHGPPGGRGSRRRLRIT